jgi:enoyl-CoA hydratase/carnithine racemase
MAVDYKEEGRIIIITINRPEALNAINTEVLGELQEIFLNFRDNDDFWVAIITGAGKKAFSAGWDITTFRPVTQENLEAESNEVESLRPDTIWKPFIAAINGYALGGGLELAMECDIRIAAENAQLGQPEINIGYMPGGGGTARLPRFIPRAIAADMLLTGNRITAQEALSYGLVSRVVPLDQLLLTAKEIANTICTRGPLGVRASKQSLIQGYDMVLEEALKLERKLSNKLMATQDFIEGARAFAERRPPEYKGR